MVIAKSTIVVALITLLLMIQGQSSSCGRSAPVKTASANANANKVAQPAQSDSEETKPTNDQREKPSVTENSATTNMRNTTDETQERGAKGVASPGTWGGDHIRLVVSADGADIEYDCAHGSIVGKLSLDKESRFNLTGTHVREGPGPIRVGRLPSSRPARYSGKVTGDEMTLTVTLTDTSQTLGTFTLTRGSEGRIRKCR